jgi:hypothetical protein
MIENRLVLGATDAPVALELRATLVALRGDARESLRLLAGSRTHAVRNGLRWPALPSTPDLHAALVAGLDDDQARRARAEGTRMTIADVPLGTGEPLHLR